MREARPRPQIFSHPGPDADESIATNVAKSRLIPSHFQNSPADLANLF